MKKHSEKTEDARPKREQQKRERASSGTRKSAALSRLVAKRLLARLARAREFVTKFLDEEGEVFAEGRSNHNQNLCAVIFGNCADIDQKKVPRKDEICKKGCWLPRRVKRRSMMV